MKERGDTIIGEGTIKFGIEYRDLLHDQGVCIHVLGDVSEDDEHELLRFDCFDHEPHYHYGPQKLNERLDAGQDDGRRLAGLDAWQYPKPAA